MSGTVVVFVICIDVLCDKKNNKILGKVKKFQCYSYHRLGAI